MSLARLQQDFQEWLTTGNPDCAPQVGADAAAGLDVYLFNYRIQLLDCLEESFPQTLAWLGEAAFRSAARQHIMGHPPSSWTLDAYPATFAAAVGALVPDDPVAPELAGLELALSDVQTAIDQPPLTRAMFTELDWETVVLTHASGGQLLHHGTNAAEIWSALSRGAPAPPPVSVRSTILVWRDGWIPHFRALDPDEALLFAEMEKGIAFTAICNALEQDLGAEAAIERAGRLLARWADDGAVSVASPPLRSAPD